MHPWPYFLRGEIFPSVPDQSYGSHLFIDVGIFSLDTRRMQTWALFWERTKMLKRHLFWLAWKLAFCTLPFQNDVTQISMNETPVQGVTNIPFFSIKAGPKYLNESSSLRSGLYLQFFAIVERTDVYWSRLIELSMLVIIALHTLAHSLTDTKPSRIVWSNLNLKVEEEEVARVEGGGHLGPVWVENSVCHLQNPSPEPHYQLLQPHHHPLKRFKQLTILNCINFLW